MHHQFHHGIRKTFVDNFIVIQEIQILTEIVASLCKIMEFQKPKCIRQILF